MIPFEHAREIILEHAQHLPASYVALDEAGNCLLAEPIIAHEDQPPFASSAVDGFALHTSDVELASVDRPVTLRIAGIIKAGDNPTHPIEVGTSFRIMTGAPIPHRCDAVIMKEKISERDSAIIITNTLSVGENIRRAGEDVRKGERVLEPGILVTPAVTGMLAALGFGSVKVIPFPRVAIVTTGDELVGVESSLGPGKIRDSNARFLEAALRALGVRATFQKEQVPDTEADTLDALTEALRDSDIVIITGGVSVGEFDYVRPILLKLGVEERFWSVAIKPGKPLFFGTRDRQMIFGLPGNPVAVGVTFYELVLPALQKLTGRIPVGLVHLRAILDAKLNKKTPRLEFVRGNLTVNADRLHVVPIDKRESHMISSFANADCLIRFPSERDTLEKDESVDVDLLPWAADLNYPMAGSISERLTS